MPDLEVQLRDLSSWVDWPSPADDLADRVLADLAPRRRSAVAARPWLAAAAVLVVVLLVVAAAPGARHAVAEWLGLAAVRITVGEEPDPSEGVGSALDLGRRVPVDSVAVPVPSALGAPDEAWERGDEESLVWSLAGGEPVVLTRLPGSAGSLLLKAAPRSTAVRQVTVAGDTGWWVDGEHVVRRPGGAAARSSQVLLWVRDGSVHRLESGLSLADALRVAESL